jgi:hypothetical protein
MSQNQLHFGQRWKLTLPNRWSSTVRKHSTALFRDSGGVGAVNVSSFSAAKTQVCDPKSVIRDFAERLGPDHDEVQTFSTSDNDVLAGRTELRSRDSASWIIAAFCADGTVLTLSYNCRGNPELERAEVEEIIRSVQLLR